MRTTLEDANDAYERGDFATARALYEALAKAGHANTLVFLARMYIEGRGGAVDLERAEALLDQAIALGVQEGLLQKAALFKARGDSERYLRSVRQAASLGSLPAEYQLAWCYWSGDGVRVDRERALGIMRAAATRGHLGAKIFLARRQLRNPLRPSDFFAGLFTFLAASVKGFYLALNDPDSDLLR